MDVYDRNTGKRIKVTSPVENMKGEKKMAEKLDLEGGSKMTKFHGEVRYTWHDGTPLKIGFTYQLVVGDEMTKPMRFGDVREVGRFLGILVKAGAITRAKAATIGVREYTKGAKSGNKPFTVEKQTL